jgi:Methylase involved in ubiquinone/menaquinone biosynthesis
VTRPWILTAVDFSGEAIRLCSRRVTCSTLRFVIANAVCLPFRESTFDAVIMFHVAGHALSAERHRIVDEAIRVVCPGGSVFFREFSRQDMRAGKGDETEPDTFMRGDGTTTHYFDRDETRSLFSPMIEEWYHVHTWSMRIRGRDLPRAEIQAEFRKKTFDILVC